MSKAAGRKRSREHAFAQWLLDEFAAEGKLTHTLSGGREGPVKRQWTTGDLDVVTRSVCEPCNNSWMCDLENSARPFLRSMLKGHGRTYYAQGMQVLAAWATKTALALELANPDPEWRRPIEPEHYRAMVAARDRPPPRTLVWFGAYRGGRHFFHWSKDIQINADAPDEVHAYDSTFIVGPAVFQVFGHLYPEEIAIEKADYRAAMARQIWPSPTEATWPPPRIMSEEDLWAFMRSFEEVPEEKRIPLRPRRAA